VAAARLALDDLAHGRVTGKRLGERHVTGDLTGLASVKYRRPTQPDPAVPARVRRHRHHHPGVLAIGIREEHAIYRLAFPVADDGTIDIPVNRPALQGGRSRLREGRGQQAEVWPHWGAVTALISHTSLDSLDACGLCSPSSSNRRHSYPLWLFAKAP